MSDDVIQIKNVSKTFGNLKAVDSISFNVKRAECVGLLGPNGAGKTTLMSIMIGRCRRDANSDSKVNIFGCDPQNDALSIKHLSGVVPQEDNLDSELKVAQNLHIYANFYGLCRSEASRRIAELLSFMHLEDKAYARIKHLSGGMKRRLLIARALLNAPSLLILDEPTTGLDPQVRHLIWDRIKKLQATGITILLTTHYMEEAEYLCNRIIMMNEGKKILEGSPKTLVKESGQIDLEGVFLSLTGRCLNDLQ